MTRGGCQQKQKCCWHTSWVLSVKALDTVPQSVVSESLCFPYPARYNRTDHSLLLSYISQQPFHENNIEFRCSEMLQAKVRSSTNPVL